MGNNTKEIIKAIIPDIYVEKEIKPSEFILKYWSIYKDSFKDNNKGLNGNVFESLVAITLIRENIMPFYMQANVAFIPNVKYDFIIYNNPEIISLSVKTSLRERYKQADLEAVALRYIHRNSESYLITLDKIEAKRIKNNKSSCMGLNSLILADEEEFNILLQRIKKIKIEISPQVSIVTSNFIIKTKDDFKKFLI